MRRAARMGLLLASVLLTVAGLAGTATAAAAAPAAGDGWIRLAHLSPNTPAVNVYLYSYGMPNAEIVLHHVSYGTVSPYEKVASGEYTVAMRGAGASPSSTPVLSSNLMVHPGHAYTVAGLGPEKALRLQVLDDRLSTPKGKSLVRVIQASLKEHQVTVRAGSSTLASNLAFASVTGYGSDSPGTWMVHAVGGTESWSGTGQADRGFHPHPRGAGHVRRLAGHRPDGRGRQQHDARRRRGDRPGRHRPGAGSLPAALAGRARRRPGAGHGGRDPDAPEQGSGPARPLMTAGAPAPATEAQPGRHGRSSSPWRKVARRPLAAAVLLAGLLAAVLAVTGLLLLRPSRPGLQPRPLSASAAAPAPLGRAAPLPQPSSSRPVPPPVWLRIPAIRVRTRLIRLGITRQGTLQVPSSTSVAGWYTHSPAPGAIGSSVIAGHIDSRLGPGIFFRLRLLRPGNRIYVRQAGGRLAVFRVTAVRQYAKARFPTARVYGPAPDAELNLITCGGVFDEATGSYLSNVVVYSTEIR